jgi:type I restriction enzyme S subunit
MNKNKKTALLPRLRFPDFRDGGEWEISSFETFIKLYRGSSPRPIQKFLTKKDGVNWIKIGDTKNADGFKIRSVEEQITHEGAQKSRFVAVGELILANSMSYGKTYEVEIDGCIYDGWFVLREYEEYFDKHFLLQQLNSNNMQKQYLALAAGGIVQNISSDIVYSTVLKRPTLEEQQKIADCLSSLDDLIAAEGKKLEAFKAHKKGLMQKLFAREIRFKKENGEDFPEWREMKINDLLETIVDNRGKTPPIATSGIPLIESSAVGNFYIDYSKVDKYVSYETYKTWFRKHLKPSDILFSTVGRTGMCSYYSGKIISVVAQNIVGLRFINNSRFMLYLLTEEKNNRYIHSIEMSAVQPSIKVTQFVELEFLIPGSDEQQKIADCLSSVDDLISAQAEKIEALKAHKKGLLQGLFPSTEEVCE